MKRLVCALYLGMSLPAWGADLGTEKPFVGGLHLGSYHNPAQEYNNFNPGVYMRDPEGMQLGVFRNSYKKTSVYAAQMFEYKYVDVLVGVATGYPGKTGLMPMLGLSKAFEIDKGSALRLTLLPCRSEGKTGMVAHMTLEFALKD